MALQLVFLLVTVLAAGIGTVCFGEFEKVYPGIPQYITKLTKKAS